MYPSIDKIKAVLLKGSYISESDSNAAEKASHDSLSYIDYLIRSELLSKSLLGQALAEDYKLSFADLEAHPISKENLALIPEETARTLRVVVVKSTDDSVLLATDTPEGVTAQKLRPFFGTKKLLLAYTLPEYINASFALYEQPLATRFSRIIESSNRVAPEIVDEIVKDAISFRASDIHFEPQADTVIVRFRVDGTLREAGTLPKEYYDNILNRVKVESGMRIDEHQAAQDGAIQRHGEGYSTDLRVSLVPTVNGEKVVMRVLSSYIQSLNLSDIGLDNAHREMVEAYASKPFGMILTTGPTGSGKTTTLYALLKLLNRSNVNVTTIEDPVEYKMAGVNQIQVREQTNMTFAKGLRAIVRQDPDIILVGEIRDRETAEISVNAALTGHILLSTFHANDAATAIPRLVEMGIEPFLLASTLEVVIAQRLVRKICSNCRHSIPASEALKSVKAPGVDLTQYLHPTDTVYAGKGCNVCSGSGYQGRMALFQFIEITPEMQELILHEPSTREIETLARTQGSVPMFDDGLQKVRNGITTISEVIRVVPPPKDKKT
ncbi:MAG TPA: GspE/PulE family protein [Candidatus Saccharimonadales bacterium]|nr:GspE/PulE family protein [Candidatus Saccharimonadales bacterium]